MSFKAFVQVGGWELPREFIQFFFGAADRGIYSYGQYGPGFRLPLLAEPASQRTPHLIMKQSLIKVY